MNLNRRVLASFAGAACVVGGFAAGVAAEGPLTLQARVLRPGELAGLTIAGRQAVVTSVDEWSQGSDSAPTLRRAGFVRGLRELLQANALRVGRPDGASIVAQFRTAAEARRQVAAQLAQLRLPSPTYAPFRVVGIPGAHGFSLTAPGRETYNVIFSDGRFQYWIVVSFGLAPAGTPTRAQVIAAAESLYRRVHGR